MQYDLNETRPSSVVNSPNAVPVARSLFQKLDKIDERSFAIPPHYQQHSSVDSSLVTTPRSKEQDDSISISGSPEVRKYKSRFVNDLLGPKTGERGISL